MFVYLYLHIYTQFYVRITKTGASCGFCLGWIPGLIGEIPFFQVGIPAFLSVYFDLFSGFVQALVFSLLTMVYVGGACPPPEEK